MSLISFVVHAIVWAVSFAGDDDRGRIIGNAVKEHLVAKLKMMPSRGQDIIVGNLTKQEKVLSLCNDIGPYISPTCREKAKIRGTSTGEDVVSLNRLNAVQRYFVQTIGNNHPSNGFNITSFGVTVVSQLHRATQAIVLARFRVYHPIDTWFREQDCALCKNEIAFGDIGAPPCLMKSVSSFACTCGVSSARPCVLPHVKEIATARLLRSDISEIGGSGGSAQSQQRDSQTAQAKVERPLRPQSALSRSVRGLPLSAKIGATIILTLGAWFCFFAGFVRVLQRRINSAQGLCYGALGLGLFAAGAFPWW